jgi:hypothetical protein
MFAAIDSAGRLSWSTRKPVSPGESLGLAADFVSEVDGFLVDDELPKGERHEPGPWFSE